jgi:hypothetical protein
MGFAGILLRHYSNARAPGDLDNREKIFQWVAGESITAFTTDGRIALSGKTGGA